MGIKKSEVLNQVAEEIFEKLAFIFSFPEDDEGAIDPEATTAAVVTFSGPFIGSLLMLIASAALPELAGNMLGLDEDETTDELQHDALKELMNVMCGNLLPRIAGQESIFNVGTPEIIEAAKAISMIEEGSRSAVAKLSLDEGRCDLVLNLDDEACE